MNIVLILACMAVFYNIDLLGYNSEYLSVQQTKNLKGIFTLIVLFHHLAIFASVGDVYNIFINSGYIAVGGFLFISGYGLMYQYMHKGGKCETKINQNVQIKTNLKTSLNNLEKIE